MVKRSTETELEQAKAMLDFPGKQDFFAREVERLEKKLAEEALSKSPRSSKKISGANGPFFRNYRVAKHAPSREGIQKEHEARLKRGLRTLKKNNEIRPTSKTVSTSEIASHTEHHDSAAVRTHVAELKIREFLRFFEATGEGKPDSDITRYLYALFLRVYVMAQADKFLSKTEACAFIPLKHPVSCYKYLSTAEERGYLKFNRDQVDRRKYMIVGTEKLISFVEREIDASLALQTAIHPGEELAIGTPVN